MEYNILIKLSKMVDGWGPGRHRPGPQPCSLFLHAFNAVGPPPAGSRLGAYSHADWGGLQHMRLTYGTSVADSPVLETRAMLLASLVWASLPRRR